MASSLFRNQEESKQQTLSNAMDQVKKMVNNRNPQEVFFEECQKRGVDANSILSIARMFKM